MLMWLQNNFRHAEICEPLSLKLDATRGSKFVTNGLTWKLLLLSKSVKMCQNKLVYLPPFSPFSLFPSLQFTSAMQSTILGLFCMKVTWMGRSLSFCNPSDYEFMCPWGIKHKFATLAIPKDNFEAKQPTIFPL
jgi:hypothetical protein